MFQSFSILEVTSFGCLETPKTLRYARHFSHFLMGLPQRATPAQLLLAGVRDTVTIEWHKQVLVVPTEKIGICFSGLCVLN
jgi:hypothetical protein